MIAINKSTSNTAPDWHDRFIEMLPKIVAHAAHAFRYFPPDARNEAIAEIVASVFVAYARLVELGKAELAYPSVLARHGVAQYHDGRRVGSSRNGDEVLSEYAQRKKEFVVENLDRFDAVEGEWKEAVVEDRQTPIPDQVAFRIDFPSWLGTLDERRRNIVEHLAIGHTTRDTSRKFNVSDGRVSQIRRQLANSWDRFRGEDLAVGRRDPVAA